jgi:hypothetical protein
MTSAPNLPNGDNKRSEAKTLSIEIEPSTPLILAIAQLFRTHKQAGQSVELCRLGLTYFPGDLGLRLGMAMAYGDLNEKEKAWSEIKSVAKELCQLSPVLEKIAEYSRTNALEGLSGWFTHLAQVLSQYPGDEPQPLQSSPLIARSEMAPSPLRDDREEPGMSREIPTESQVLSTLNAWLSQLKKNKEVV